MTTKELIEILRDESNPNVLDYIDEAANRLAALEAELIDERYRHDRYADYTRGLEQKLAQAKAGSRWIPVTERLPQEDLPVGAVCDTVQVLLQSGEVTVGWCNRGLKCWYYLLIDKAQFVGHGYDLTPVVAWAPLLEPPKEVE